MFWRFSNFIKFLILIIISTFLSGVFATCDKNLLQGLTFRLGGNNLEWPCPSTKNIYIQASRYIPRNVIVTRAQINKDEAFVALPRLKSGVPFSLGKINLKRGECYSTLAPYPCWSIQEEGNCQALQSVVDIFLDGQGILWALDVGIVNVMQQPIHRCPPKVYAFNTATNKLVKIIDLTNLVTPATRLQYISVDYNTEGQAFVYISDAGTGAILVHDCTNDKQHRIVLPDACSSGANDNDVLYTVLVRKSTGTNVLYFTYLGSSRLFSIKTEHLRRGQGSGAVVDVGPTPGGKPIVLLGTDNGASLFLRYKGQSDIYLWNTETCFKSSNFLEVQRGGECRLATQVIPGYRKFMWALESNFQDFISNTVGCNGASVILHPVVKNCDA